MKMNLDVLREALYARENEMAAQFEAVREAIYAHPELGCEALRLRGRMVGWTLHFGLN